MAQRLRLPLPARQVRCLVPAPMNGAAVTAGDGPAGVAGDGASGSSTDAPSTSAEAEQVGPNSDDRQPRADAAPAAASVRRPRSRLKRATAAPAPSGAAAFPGGSTAPARSISAPPWRPRPALANLPTSPASHSRPHKIISGGRVSMCHLSPATAMAVTFIHETKAQRRPGARVKADPTGPIANVAPDCRSGDATVPA